MMPLTINIPQSVALRSRRFRADHIPGLALWLDPSDSSTVTLDGSGNVSQLNDKSGNSNHAAQAGVLLRPSLAGLINGLAALDFDGTDDFMEIANSATIDLAPNLSIFIVHKADTVMARQTLFNFLNGHSGTATPSIEIGTSGSTYVSSYSLIRPSQFMLNGPMDAATTSPAVIGVLVESSANLTLRKNRVEIATATSGVTLVPSGTVKLIGARAAGSQRFNGLIGEVIAYSGALSTPQIEQIEAYLKAKWGTP